MKFYKKIDSSLMRFIHLFIYSFIHLFIFYLCNKIKKNKKLKFIIHNKLIII